MPPRNTKLQIGVQITVDLTKSGYYALIELSMLVVRIIIYRRTSLLFESNIATANSVNEKKKQRGQNKMAILLTLYSVPFFVCITLWLVFRLGYDIDLFVRIAKGTLTMEYESWQKVLLALIRLVYPTKGILDAICYCFISRWFAKEMRRILCCYCCHKKKQVKLIFEDDDSESIEQQPMMDDETP